MSLAKLTTGSILNADHSVTDVVGRIDGIRPECNALFWNAMKNDTKRSRAYLLPSIGKAELEHTVIFWRELPFRSVLRPS